MKDVVEQPSFDALLVEGFLDGVDVGHMVCFGNRAAASNNHQRASARTASAVTPRISTRFVRLRSPDAILTADSGTFKLAASNRRNASFARSSTGGAVRRISSPSCHSPAISSRLA